MEISSDKKHLWIDLINKLGLKEAYGKIFKEAIMTYAPIGHLSPDDQLRNECIEEAQHYYQANIPIDKILPEINRILTEQPEKIILFNEVFSEYNSFPPYSTQRSDTIVATSIEKLSSKFGNSAIPLVYTTLQIPHLGEDMIDAFAELKSISSFAIEDYGNIDLIDSLIDMREKGILDIKSFEITLATNRYIILKIIVKSKKPLSKIYKDKIEQFNISEKSNTPVTYGDLSYFPNEGKNGTFRFKGEIIELRKQMKHLCELFLRNNKHILSEDFIKNEIIDSSKRDSLKEKTIAKYVNELDEKLSKYYGKQVIENTREDGWMFNPDK